MWRWATGDGVQELCCICKQDVVWSHQCRHFVFNCCTTHLFTCILSHLFVLKWKIFYQALHLNSSQSVDQSVSPSWQGFWGERGVLWARGCHPSETGEHAAGCPGWGNPHPNFHLSICRRCHSARRSGQNDVGWQKGRGWVGHSEESKLSCDERLEPTTFSSFCCHCYQRATDVCNYKLL